MSPLGLNCPSSRRPAPGRLRRVAALVLGCGTALGAASCAPVGDASNSGPVRGGTLLVSRENDFTTLDPAMATDPGAWSVERAVFDGLVDHDAASAGVVPDLAGSLPTVSADGRTYSFALRHGARFSTGRELVADDIKYSLERMLDPHTHSPGSLNPGWLVIHGVAPFRAGSASHIEGILVRDSYTLELDLDTPSAVLLELLATPFAMVVPREVVETPGRDWAHAPVGTGPYLVAAHVPGSRLILERNPRWQGTEGFLQRIQFKIGITPADGQRLLAEKAVDIPNPDAAMPPADYLTLLGNAEGADRIVRQPLFDGHFLAINSRVAPFNDRAVRLAVAHLVDRAAVVQRLSELGVPLTGLESPAMTGFDRTYNPLQSDVLGTSLDRARSLLKQAGYGDHRSVPSVTLVYARTADGSADAVASAIHDALRTVGIQLVNQGVPADQFVAAASKPGAGLSLGAWSSLVADPSGAIVNFTCAGDPASPFNPTRYCSREVDALAARAAGLSDPSLRQPLYRQIQDIILARDIAVVPLYADIQSDVAAPRVHGYRIDPFWSVRLTDLWVTGPAPSPST